MRCTPETGEKQAVKDYLSLMRYFHFPLTAGMGSYRGAPDRIAIKCGKVYAIEVKGPKGKLTPYEEGFALAWRASGGIYLHGTFDDIREGLKGHS